MAQELIANNYSTTLASGCAGGDTSITVSDSPPAALTATGAFRILIDTEFMLVTGVSGTGNKTFAVSRGAATGETPTPTAASHLQGAAVTHLITATGLANFLSTNLSTAQTLTAPYSQVATDQVLLANADSGCATVTLLPVASWPNRRLTIKRAGTNRALTTQIIPPSGVTIDQYGLAAPTQSGSPTVAAGGFMDAAAYPTVYAVVTALNDLGESVASAEQSVALATNALAPPAFTTSSVATTGGTIIAGAVYYVITALNANGETLRSQELVVVTGVGTPITNLGTAYQGIPQKQSSTGFGQLAAGSRYYKVTALNLYATTTVTGNCSTTSNPTQITGIASTTGITTGMGLANNNNFPPATTVTNVTGTTLTLSNSCILNGTGASFTAGTIGESLPSTEITLTTLTGGIGTNLVSFQAVAGAWAHRVYAGSTPGGENTYGTVASQQPTNGVVTLTFEDWGQTLTSGSPPGADTTNGGGAATSTNTVTVNWGAVAGATGYRLYRCQSVYHLGSIGSYSGHQHLFVNTGNVTTFTDTGSNITTAGSPPVVNTTGSTVTVNWTDSQAANQGYRVYIGQSAAAENLYFTALPGATSLIIGAGFPGISGIPPAASTADLYVGPPGSQAEAETVTIVNNGTSLVLA